MHWAARQSSSWLGQPASMRNETDAAALAAAATLAVISSIDAAGRLRGPGPGGAQNLKTTGIMIDMCPSISNTRRARAPQAA
jgi:hypothetical protein